MRTSELLIAGLIALVIFGAFYAGLSTDFNSFLSGANNIVNTLQGRTAQGTFPAYPSNAPSVSNVALQG